MSPDILVMKGILPNTMGPTYCTGDRNFIFLEGMAKVFLRFILDKERRRVSVCPDFLNEN
jgi:hypothetical protein